MEKKINEDMADYRLELKNTHQKYSKDEINEIIKKKKEEVKSEIWEYIKEFMELFKKPTFNEAIDYVNKLKKRNKRLSKTFSKLFEKKFFHRIQKILKIPGK